MGSQHQNEPKSPTKAGQTGQKSGQRAQQRAPQHRDDDHTNSARAGENMNRPEDDDDADSQRAQHASTRNLETEPDRARPDKYLEKRGSGESQSRPAPAENSQ